VKNNPCEIFTCKFLNNISLEKKMRALSVSIILVLFLMTGCGDTTTSRSLSGGAMAAAAGGLIGSMSGNFGEGAAIGAGVGLVGGFLDDQYKKGNID
jgi:hypothetical protein